VTRVYIWNVERLAMEIREGRLTQRDQFVYFLIALAITFVVGRGSILWIFRQPAAGIFPTAQFLISVGGFVRCYRTNHRGDDRDFIARVTCLGLPLLVRAYTLYGVLAALIYLLTGIKGPWSAPTSWTAWIVWGALYVGVQIAFFQQLERYVGQAAGSTVAKQTA
jgi:hypothetical protein